MQTRAHRTAPAIGVPRADAATRKGLRVFAMQYKQDVSAVATYDTFRHRIDCMIRDYVEPNRSTSVPNLVVFNEDIGLATIATGSRGASARAFAASPAGGGLGDQGPAPAAAAEALGLVNAGYAREVAYYRSKFPGVDPRKQVFLAATDTFARGFSQTFSDLARQYNVYIVAANNQADFVESHDPADIAALADPDLAAQYASGALDSVYVATGPNVWNQVFLWGPNTVDPNATPPMRNMLFQNKKVPLTSIEKDFIGLDEGPATGPDAGPNIGPVNIPGTAAQLGFATSLPAFVYGYRFGGSLPAGTDPCADTSQTYMPCMDARGANVVIQDEANPGRWATPGGTPAWQPLDWMGSAWRAVADPATHFRYAVCPHMVGNLLDLAFDGQTAITSRDGGNAPADYVGDDTYVAAEDGADPPSYAGKKDQFLALAPWVIDTNDRATLRAVGARLAPGSGDPLENDYLETAVWADLVF
ncbi:MAG: hypothetical protein ABR552_10180 [Actinomycetota bacterium]